LTKRTVKGRRVSALVQAQSHVRLRWRKQQLVSIAARPWKLRERNFTAFPITYHRFVSYREGFL
jgi:hypothetical protein